MKNNKLMIVIFFLACCLAGCKDVLDEQVSRDTIGIIMEAIQSKKINLSDEEVATLKLIEELARSREEQFNLLNSNGDTSTARILINMYVDEYEYKRRTDNFFESMKKHGIRYRTILNELSLLKKLRENKYKSEIDKEAEELDKICTEIQMAINKHEAYLKNIDNIVTLKVTGMKDVSTSSKKRVALEIDITNGFKEPVYSVAFNIQAKDFDGNIVTEMYGDIKKKIYPLEQRIWTWDKDFIVIPLLEKGYSNLVFTSHVSEINIDGLVHKPASYSKRVTSLPYGVNYNTNFNYQAGGNSGYCPYLDKNQTEPQMRLQRIEYKINEELVKEGFWFNKIYSESSIYKE